MGRPAGSTNKAKDKPKMIVPPIPTIEECNTSAPEKRTLRIDHPITLTVPPDALHGPEGLQAMLQEWLDKALPGETVHWQVR